MFARPPAIADYYRATSSRTTAFPNRRLWCCAVSFALALCQPMLSACAHEPNCQAGQGPSDSPSSNAKIVAQDGDAPKQEYESIFDGKSLAGWSGDERVWSVQDGALIGQTTADKPIDGNTFLIWKGGELQDFELKLKFRLEGGNSGVQYRSQDLGDHHVGGYQADFDADHTYTGILYDERGRGILANRTTKVEIDAKGEKKVLGKTCDEAELLASMKNNEWSEYTITAKGNHLTQSINGFVTIDVIDGQADQAESQGILALQVHAGPPMKVQFKDIRLKHLGARPNAKK